MTVASTDSWNVRISVRILTQRFDLVQQDGQPGHDPNEPTNMEIRNLGTAGNAQPTITPDLIKWWQRTLAQTRRGGDRVCACKIEVYLHIFLTVLFVHRFFWRIVDAHGARSPRQVPYAVDHVSSDANTPMRDLSSMSARMANSNGEVDLLI